MVIQSSIITTIMVRKGESITKVKFTEQTASLTLKVEHTTQGIIKKYNLSFKIQGISDENESIVGWLQNSSQFIVTDAHGFITQIGSQDSPVKLSYQRDTAGFAGGTRGYELSVTWNSL